MERSRARRDKLEIAVELQLASLNSVGIVGYERTDCEGDALR